MPILNEKLTVKQQEFVEVLLAIVMKHHSQLGSNANPFATVKFEQSPDGSLSKKQRATAVDFDGLCEDIKHEATEQNNKIVKVIIDIIHR